MACISFRNIWLHSRQLLEDAVVVVVYKFCHNRHTAYPRVGIDPPPIK